MLPDKSHCLSSLISAAGVVHTKRTHNYNQITEVETASVIYLNFFFEISDQLVVYRNKPTKQTSKNQQQKVKWQVYFDYYGPQGFFFLPFLFCVWQASCFLIDILSLIWGNISSLTLLKNVFCTFDLGFFSFIQPHYSQAFSQYPRFPRYFMPLFFQIYI